MNYLQLNSKIAISIVICFLVGIIASCVFMSLRVNAAVNEISRLEQQIAKQSKENTPKKAMLTKRKETMQIVTNAMNHIEQLLVLSDGNASTTSNTMQTAILSSASQSRVAVRNYTPKLGALKVGNSVYSGNITSFTAHGDYKQLIQFVASLENNLPLMKIRKVQILPEVSAGGKLRMSIELFVPQKEF